jgi:hypothetical protein
VPGVGYGDDSIAFDHDSGWGALSRLTNLALPEAGEYLVVVGTGDGQGRGNYTLSAECANGQCEVVDPALLDQCDNAVLELIDDCVAEAIFLDPFIDPDLALEDCTADGMASFYFDILCFPSFAVPREWCPVGEDRFIDEMMPECRLSFFGNQPMSDVSLTEEFLSNELELLEEIANECASCEVKIASYTYDPIHSGMSIDEAVEAVRAHIDGGAEYDNDGAVSVAALVTELQAHLVDEDEFLTEAAAQSSATDFDLGQADRFTTPFPNVDAVHDLFVLHYSDSAHIVTVEFVDFFD